jgi:hypothetical protein
MFIVGQGRFVLRNCASLIFRDGQSVPENEEVLSQICQGRCVQGPFRPRDVSYKKIFDVKSIGRSFSGKFRRGTDCMASTQNNCKNPASFLPI